MRLKSYSFSCLSLLTNILFFCALTLTSAIYPRNVLAEDAAIAAAQDVSAAFERVADAASPSVVSITAVVKPKQRPARGARPQLPDHLAPFKDFFGEDLFDQFKDNGGNQGSGLGTGVIVDDEGRILTNNHVIKGADEVTVRLQNDPKPYKAKILGTDPRSDLAVIQIQGSKVTPAKLGSSADLKIGQWVVAIGNPFGLTNSITQGIISAKGRSLMGGGQFEDFIQTDAAINPGNSGGPLVNLKGEVIGINTAIFSRSGGYMGIGFAIPIDMAKDVMKSLISNGKVVRGWLGVIIQPVTEDLARSLKYTGTEGALVSQIEKGSPADKAGFKAEDIIIKVNGAAAKGVTEVRNSIAALAPNTSAEITVIRAGKEKNLSVKIGELPDSSNKSPVEEEEKATLGLYVEPMTIELARRLRSKYEEGVVVTRVEPGSVADSAGIAPRDVIVSINGEKITSVKEFEKILKGNAINEGVRMIIESQGLDRFVFLKAQPEEE